MTKTQLIKISKQLDLPKDWVVLEVLPRAKQNPLNTDDDGPIADFIILGTHNKSADDLFSEAKNIVKQLNKNHKQPTKWDWVIGDCKRGAYYAEQNFFVNEWE